jgi:hypothetical protein
VLVAAQLHRVARQGAALVTGAATARAAGAARRPAPPLLDRVPAAGPAQR